MVPPCVRAKSPQLCPTLCDPWTVSSVHVILQTRILEWVVVRSSRRSSQPRYRTHISWVSCIGKRIRYHYCHLVTQSCPTLRDSMDCSTPGFPVLHHLPEFVQTHVHQVGDAIQPSVLSCPLHLLLSIFPRIRVFYNKLALCIRWPKYWSFSFSITPSNGYSRLISFRIGCFDFLVVQKTLKILLQLHSSKASILWWSACFMVQLSHLYTTTGKTKALTRWAFFGKVCLCFLICCLGLS